MSNEESANPAAGAPDQPTVAEGQARPQFLINAQYVRDLSFENPSAPQSLAHSDGNPNVQLNVDVRARNLDKNRYEVVLVVKASAKRGEETSFMVELEYAAMLTAENIPQDQMEALLMVEAPRILFPFAREIIATATRDGGFPPLMMQPVDFVAMFRAHKARQQQDSSEATIAPATAAPIVDGSDSAN